MKLPPPPPEVPRIADVSKLAPRFRAALYRALEEMRRAGFDPIVEETIRSPERQAWLYGFGRDYDDGRKIVTWVHQSWHTFGLAADIISRSMGWNAPSKFWNALGAASKDEGLIWGGTWKSPDRPHVQWGYPMRQAPSPRAAQLVATGGLPALWREVRADG